MGADGLADYVFVHLLAYIRNRTDGDSFCSEQVGEKEETKRNIVIVFLGCETTFGKLKQFL